MTSWPLFSRQFSILKYFLFSPVALVAQIAPPPTRANTEPPTTIIGARNPVAVATPYKALATIIAPVPVPTLVEMLTLFSEDEMQEDNSSSNTSCVIFAALET